MSEELAFVKDVATVASPFTSALVETWVKPKLHGFFRGQKHRRALLEHSLASRFDEYLQRSYDAQSYITTVVFQNQRQLLEDLYLPITVEAVSKNTRFRIDSYREDFIPKYERVLLIDTAGMGKSTVLKYLFLQCIKQNAGIPVFIELRHLSSERSILDLMYEELVPIEGELDRDLILQFLRRGDFVFFLDGYDEIALNDRSPVTRALQSFISKASNNRFILSSRPEPAIATFADFQQFTVRPLEIKEAFSLIRKYGDDGDTANRLIAKLKGETLRSVHEFLTNPLLVSLLYKCYDYKPTIPLRKHIFYRQVYDALFESHDLTKGGAYIRDKHSGLDIDDFHRVLRHFGYITFTHGKSDYAKDEILKHLEAAARQCPGIEYKAADFLRDLTTTVPLFVVEGNDYRWGHKSIQEYFTAQYISVDAKTHQAAILRRMSVSRERLRHLNVMDLCYDIDYKAFRHTLIYPLAQRYIAYADSFRQRDWPDSVPEEDCFVRMQLMFGRRFVLFPATVNGFESLLTDFDHFHSYALELGLEGESGIMSGLVLWPDDGALMVVSEPDATLADLLTLKGDPLVTTVELRRPRSSKGDNEVTPRSIVRGKKPIVVSDSVPASLNRRATFTKLNVLLATATQRYAAALNLQRCIALVEDVANEEEREKELDSLAELL